jgi:hypothetical protein
MKCTCGCVCEKAGDGEDCEEPGEKAVGVRVGLSLVPHGSAGLESPFGCDPAPYMGSAGARVHPRTQSSARHCARHEDSPSPSFSTCTFLCVCENAGPDSAPAATLSLLF